MTSGIAIDLSGGEQLTIGVLRSDSTYINMPIKSDCLNMGDEDVQMVAILRDNKVFLPHPEMVLQSGDRLMMITSPTQCVGMVVTAPLPAIVLEEVASWRKSIRG